MIHQYNNRLIAFLDVLGFSSKFRNEKISTLHGVYSEFIDEARNATFFKVKGDKTGRKNFEFSQFLFDSIVLVSYPIDDVYNVNNFLSANALLLELGFRKKLPLRGAISQGNFLFDEERNIFLSGAFPELVNFEKEQEWVGCTILKNAEDTVLKSVFGNVDTELLIKNQTRNQLVHLYKTPLKIFSEEVFVVLNYLFFLTEKEIIDGLSFLIEPKYLNTNVYFEFLKNIPCHFQILGKEFLPAVKMTSISTRSGVRVEFLNEDGLPCKPEIKEFSITAVGRWKE